MDKTSPLQPQEDEEYDETISLSNFPLSPYRLADVHRENKTEFLPSDASDFFEFFTSQLNDIDSHAEDIIYCGKLIPFKFNDYHRENPKKERFIRRRSESSPELTSSDQYRKIISRESSFDSESSDIRNTSSSVPSSFRYGRKISNPKPWWHIMLFGRLSIHREMEVRDMKNRGVFRTSSAPIVFPATKAVKTKKAAVNRKRYWGVLLKVLSCTEDVGYMQTTSLK